MLQDEGQDGWGFLATWGPQSLDGSQLGMAILYPKSQLIQLAEDEHNHVAVLRPDGGTTLSYYFLAAWEQEPGGIKTEEAFRSYLVQTIKALNTPVEASLGPLPE